MQRRTTTYWIDARLTEDELQLILDLLDSADPDGRAHELHVDPAALKEKLVTHANALGELIVSPLPPRNEPLEDLPYEQANRHRPHPHSCTLTGGCNAVPTHAQYQ